MRRRTRVAEALSLIATLCVVGVSALLLRRRFQGSPPDNFTDLYLLCVLILAYRHPWKLAAALTVVTLAVSVYLLSPITASGAFQIVSYGVCASLIIWIMATLRRRARTR